MTHSPKKCSLKLALTLPYALLIAIATMLLIGASYWLGSQSVSTLSEQLMREIVARIGQAVHHHVYGSSAVLEAAFPDGMPAGPNIAEEWDALRERLWAATSLHTNPNDYVYYGNELGQGFGIKRLSANKAELRVKLEATAHRDYFHFEGINGPLIKVSQEANLFDPRSRAWYKLARLTAHHTWTTVYIDFNNNDLVVTRARRVLSPAGEFAGVVATDVSLQALNTFVGNLDVGANGRAFIVERTGMLIAASETNVIRESPNSTGVSRISIAETNDSILQTAYKTIMPHFDECKKNEAPVHFITTSPDGEVLHLAAQRITDDAGLDWIAAVALPRSQLLANINSQFKYTLGISIAAVLLVILIGLRIFGRIAEDVASLSNAVAKIRRGEFDTPIEINRQDEVGQLARNFREMHTDLFTDKLTEVANRAALDAVLAQATTSKSTAFSLFFIDLNRFKPLNDTWGHDNGDRALKEIASRLQASMRPGDVVARLGGDEFVTLAWNVTSTNAIAAIVAKLRTVIEQPLRTLEKIPPTEIVSLGAAIGVASWPQDASDAQTLLQQADAAMYRDKGSARRT